MWRNISLEEWMWKYIAQYNPIFCVTNESVKQGFFIRMKNASESSKSEFLSWMWKFLARNLVVFKWVLMSLYGGIKKYSCYAQKWIFKTVEFGWLDLIRLSRWTWHEPLESQSPKLVDWIWIRNLTTYRMQAYARLFLELWKANQLGAWTNADCDGGL